ncbi:MAG TPA: 4Fe-4S double cluster binding domain-containing protein [Thermodesulfobacteriota bacterium]|nr:4Fe-4S double cluster binding domain-containing protein [Thermodesulfobacteriota bacterium]
MENKIREKALELGYEDCGIIKVGALAGYREKLEERISRIPMGEKIYGRFRSYADPSADNLEIRSIIVAIVPTYRYNVPGEFDGVYGKAYMFDCRTDEKAPFFSIRKEFSTFLESLGLKCMLGGDHGIAAPARWAAYQAGLGIIRQNNFFYTQNGSYNRIEMFAVDRELELIRDVKLKDCSKECGKCVKACPTHTLCAPYTMSMIGCVSFQTNLSANMGMGVPSSEMTEQIGGRLYGCDACQDVCPFNKGKWTGGEEFPGLDALAPSMRPENIMGMSYDEIGRILAPKYWYIKPENLWKWKLNALTVMMNDYNQKYEAPIKLGLEDPNENVREFSRSVCSKLQYRFKAWEDVMDVVD